MLLMIAAPPPTKALPLTNPSTLSIDPGRHGEQEAGPQLPLAKPPEASKLLPASVNGPKPAMPVVWMEPPLIAAPNSGIEQTEQQTRQKANLIARIIDPLLATCAVTQNFHLLVES
jgi:hypothetical protein